LFCGELKDSIMPRGRKRKCVALEDEPLADYGTTRDGETDNGTTRDDGGPQNPTGGGEDSRTGNTTRTADIAVIVIERLVTALEGVVAAREQTVVLTALDDIHQPL